VVVSTVVKVDIVVPSVGVTVDIVVPSVGVTVDTENFIMAEICQPSDKIKLIFILF
jgi:hypothetical protein